MNINIVGGSWLRDRNNYDKEMCDANGWECIQNTHYDAIINGERFEVKKTKSSGVIIKLQQLADILLDKKLSDINYLIIRTDQKQQKIIKTYIISGIELCKIMNISKQLAEKVLYVHNAFECTLQTTVKLRDIEKHESCSTNLSTAFAEAHR